MSIGLSGPHRCGKTTLAKAYAEKAQIPLCLTATSAVFKRMGFDPQKNYDFATRLQIQEEILLELTSQYEEARSKGSVFIADRTPIDMMAYTLADVSRERISDELEEQLSSYLNRCVRVCNRFFSVIVVVQPGIPLVDDSTKAPIGNGYIEHFSSLVMGLTVGENISATHLYIPRAIVDLKQRVDAVYEAYQRILSKHDIALQGMADSNGRVKVH